MKTISILLIDDFEASSSLAELLIDETVDTTCVQNGDEAINIFRDNPFFDLIITELNLPDTDGFEILKEIRKIDSLVPIILYTSPGGKETLGKCLGAGFNDLILKPVAKEKLICKVKKKRFIELNSYFSYSYPGISSMAV
jgi:CheY-like chemotaxis protein